MHGIGIFPRHEMRAEYLARAVERAVVKVDDAQIATEGRGPLQLLGKNPL